MDINSENRDEIIFSYIEGLLDEEQKAAFETLIASDESLRAEVAIFKKTAFVVPEPLTGYKDMSHELLKSKFPSKWAWFGFAGLVVFISGVFAIYYVSRPSKAHLIITGSANKDSILVEKKAENPPLSVPVKDNKSKNGVEKKQEEILSSEDKKLSNISLPDPIVARTVTGGTSLEIKPEVPIAEEKKIATTDTILPNNELKVNSLPVTDTSLVKKAKTEVKKVAKAKPSKKLNIKGTEEIKTNSSLY